MPGLKIRIFKGERFKVGNRYLSVVEIKGPSRFVLEVEGGMTARFDIRSKPPVEVLPAVMINAGEDGHEDSAVVVIDAPRHIRIERLQNKPEERFVADIEGELLIAGTPLAKS